MSQAFKEYPQWVTINGKRVLVNDAYEHRMLDDGFEPANPDADLPENPLVDENPVGFGKNLGTPNQLKETLYNEALELGIPAKKTWGVEKLKKAIDNYGK